MTIKDVAEAAGVAASTVSYVLNNSAPIGQATRQRVLAAAAEVGYRRNMAAASLRRQTSGMIGLILPSISNPFYGELAQGVESVASEYGYIITYGTTGYSHEVTARYLDAFAEYRVDGVIFTAGTPEEMQLLHAYNRPAVIVDAHVDASMVEYPSVDAENLAASCELVRHIIRLGHRRIGALMMSPGAGSPLDNLRLQGYLLALQQAGIPVDLSLVQVASLMTTDIVTLGRHLAEQLLAKGKPPTAIFGLTDQLALGAIRAIRELGMSVPEDIAVVGFDDIAYASLSAPPLTTVAQPKFRMGVVAMRLLQELLEHKLSRPYRRAVLPTELVIRESCGSRLGQIVARD